MSFKTDRAELRGRTRSREELIKTKSRKAIRGFRDGLNFSNFAEKTKELFKDRLKDNQQVLSNYQDELVTLKSEVWRARLTKVFKELRGENLC